MMSAARGVENQSMSERKLSGQQRATSFKPNPLNQGRRPLKAAAALGSSIKGAAQKGIEVSPGMDTGKIILTNRIGRMPIKCRL
jgi:hypothetical protein